MTTISRRTALKRTGGGALAAMAMAAGWLRPADALADWNKGAFEAKTLGDALKNLKIAAPAETRDIAIRAPDIAENGAVVPIEIQSNLPGTRSMAVLIEKNPFPYAGELRLLAGRAAVHRPTGEDGRDLERARGGRHRRRQVSHRRQGSESNDRRLRWMSRDTN